MPGKFIKVRLEILEIEMRRSQQKERLLSSIVLQSKTQVTLVSLGELKKNPIYFFNHY